MHVRVLVMVVVLMIVYDVTVRMHMGMRPIPPRLPEPPREIHETERQQRPTGDIASYALDFDKRCELCAHQQTNGADSHRAQHMTQAAEKRDSKSPRHAPATRFTHRREDEVMVRTEYRMQKRYRCRSQYQNLSFIHYNSLTRPLARARYVITGSNGAQNGSSERANCRSLRQYRRVKRKAPQIAATILLSATLLASCATEPRTEFMPVAQSTECVVLLHGLNRSWRAMRPMAEALQEAGFTTANVDYPSQAGPVEEIAPLAVGAGLEECRAAGAHRIHFVTHSIGGILLRFENKRAPIHDLGRVVMLGPPNQGSELVDKTQDWIGFEAISGAAGMQLGTDANSLPAQLGPVEFELGVIAGTGTINVLASAMLPNPDDGKVSVAATQVEGMDDFLVVGNSHRYITRSNVVVRNTESFLKTGRFIDADKSLVAFCDEAGATGQVIHSCP